MSRAPSQARHSSAGLAPYPPPANASHGSFLAPGPPHAGPNNMSMSVISRPRSRAEPPPLSSTLGPLPGSIERPINGPRKRLIMTCDGTWLNADSAIQHGQKTPPSNVSRIGWAIKETSRDGIPQIVNYQAGVGTDGGTLSRIIGGATGHGLKENVREAYTYIATNWRRGDEIFLIGFSRGAFTARSVAGFIGELGLLTRQGLPYFNEIWEDFEHKLDDRYVSPFPDIPFRKKGPFDRRYISRLERKGMTRTGVDIKAICCFDTVGSLGVPSTPFSGMRKSSRQARGYQFFDTTLSPCIENAFQALALDEHRAAFSPALWEKTRDNHRTNLKQVWFPGVHSNIGGGYEDQEIANMTLAWMMSRLEPFLDFRPDFLISQCDENVAYYKDTGQKPRWWSFGEIYRSLKGVYSFGGSKIRTPGNYYRVDPITNKPTSERLQSTHEYIHTSVRTRVGLQGPGVEDKGVYDPRALNDWSYEISKPRGPGQEGNMADGGLVTWVYNGPNELHQTEIPEAVLLETELALLRQSQRVLDFVRTGAKPKSSRRRGTRHSTVVNGNDTANGAAGSPTTGQRRRSARYDSRPPPDDRLNGDLDSADERDRRRRRRRSEDPTRRREREVDEDGDGRRSRRYDDGGF